MVKISDDIVKILKKESFKSNVVRSKMSAMVYASPEIRIPFVLKAYNYQLCSNEIKRPYTLHAEEHLIAKAAKKGLPLNGSTVIVYRYLKYAKATSRPCSACANMLYKAGVKNVIYLSNGDWVTDSIFRMIKV